MRVHRAIVTPAFTASVPLFLMVAYAAPPRLGLAWDVPMALGAAALGALAVLPVLTARQWLAATASVRLARFAHCHHRHLSYAVAFLVAVHAVWPLAAEPRLLEYLKPGAPWPMLAGVGAALLVALVMLTSLGRGQRRDYAGWRRRHRLWSAAALTLALWHVVGSGYYYPRLGQVLALALAVAVPLAAVYRPPPGRYRPAAIPPANERHAIGGERRHSGSVLLALLLLWSALAVLHALPGAGVEDGAQHCPCPEARPG